MPSHRLSSARLLAGAFFLCAAAAAAADARIEIAANRTDGCPAGGPPWGLAVVGTEPVPARCVAVVRPADLSDAAIEAAASALARSKNVPAVLLDFSHVPASATDPEHLALALKRLASAARSSSPSVKVGMDVSPEQSRLLDALTFWSANAPYWDAVVSRPGRGPVATGDAVPPHWLVLSTMDGTDPESALIRAIAADPDPEAIQGLWIEAPVASGWEALVRLQRYFVANATIGENVAAGAPRTAATAPDGRAIPLAASYDPKELTPLLFLPQDAVGTVRLDLAGGPFAKASVENLVSGAQRDFDLAGAKTLTLDLSKGPLAVVLRSGAKAGGETRAEVEVGAPRGLTADEIVARERAWDAGQRERMHTFIADMKTSLRFRIAEVNETFDLTIVGTLYSVRGKEPDWSWHEFYLNGVKWKGRELPKLPILQPEKVTALPLDIRLTEDYVYDLKKETTISGRHAYEIDFKPRASVGDKPIYRGTAWIDSATFALLRRDTVQLNLTGETLSNAQTEIYKPVPGNPDVVLPLTIKGQQVFSTAGRTTAIERDVEMSDVRVNPPDYDAKLAEEYASMSQMIRDTDHGLRYLVPDPAHPGARLVEEHVSRKSTFGLLGGFYDKSLDYPIPLIGLQHFDFDLWGKGKQLSVFFGGVLLTANYTDPALAGSRFDLGADLFAVAIPFGDVSFKNGVEVPDEKIKHLPAVFQVNLGHPLGPWLKASVGVFSKWDNYQRDSDTAPEFVTPVDTFTNGASLRLVANFSGFNVTIDGEYDSRAKWESWGLPGNTDYSPDKKDYWKYSVSVAKDQYFSGFKKLHVGFQWYDGSDLDRFSKYEFGTFSGHPIHGYQSGSLRTQEAFLMNLSYGLNIEDIIRFEAFYDQAILNDRVSGFHNTYFSGAGLLASLNGPWKNSLIRGEIGVPVVSHGIHGVVVSVTMLKLF